MGWEEPGRKTENTGRGDQERETHTHERRVKRGRQKRVYQESMLQKKSGYLRMRSGRREIHELESLGG